MSKPFIVVDGQVYMNAALVAEAAIEIKIARTQADIMSIVTDVKLVGSNGFELDFKTGEFRIGDRLVS